MGKALEEMAPLAARMAGWKLGLVLYLTLRSRREGVPVEMNTLGLPDEK